MTCACTLPGKSKKNKKVHRQVGIHKKETFWGIKNIYKFYVRPWVNKKQISIKNSPKMPYVQPFCPDGNIKSVKFGSKVEFTKIRTRTCYFRFFKDYLNRRGGTPIKELDEGIVSTFTKFKYERSSSKTEWVFEKTNMISCFSLERKTNFWAGSKFNVEIWPALRKGSGWSYSHSALNTIGTRGGKKKYDNGDYYDDDDDAYYDYDDNDDDYNLFSSTQRTSNRDGTRGSQQTMMMMTMMMTMMIIMMIMFFFSSTIFLVGIQYLKLYYSD